MKVDLLGIRISADSKQVILEQINSFLDRGQQLFIVTPYAEFFQRCFRDQKFRTVLNSADFAIPDGISVLWMAHYLMLPLKSKTFYPKVFEAFWQMVVSGLQIIFQQQKIRNVIPEQIPGVDFFWDLVELASKRKLSIFLLGGFGNTPEIVKQKILQRYPDVTVAGIYNGSPNDPHLVNRIRDAKADVLMVAFGPVTQEFWISNHLKSTGAKIAIGLGGTFDYIAEKKKRAPETYQKLGLEWLYKLFTQPYRFKRIFNATVGLLLGVIRFKVWSTMSMRPNVVAVIINKQNKVFIGSRILSPQFTEVNELSEHWQFPQGGVDLGEDPTIAVLREVQEETGIQSARILGKSEQTNSYIWNNTVRPLFFNQLKFKGQEQHLYYLRFDGDDSEIDLQQPGHYEFKDWKWVDPQQLEKNVHPYRLSLVHIVMTEIRNYLDR